MTWEDQGQPIDAAATRRFESVSGFQLPEPVRWFLEDVTNGGHPEAVVDVPIRGNGDEEFFTLHGIYGLGEVEDTYDMLRICEAYRNRLKRFVPIGFDDCNGQILYVRNGLRKGQVWLMPWDSFPNRAGKRFTTSPRA